VFHVREDQVVKDLVENLGRHGSDGISSRFFWLGMLDLIYAIHEDSGFKLSIKRK